MNEEPEIHQSVANDGVSDKSDINQTEVRTEPIVCRLACDKREYQIGADPSSEATNNSHSQVIELCLYQSSSRASFLHKDPKSDAPSRNEVQREDWIEWPGHAR